MSGITVNLIDTERMIRRLIRLVAAPTVSFLLLLFLTLNTIPALAQQRVSLESVSDPGHFLRHRSSFIYVTEVKTSADRADATFIVRPALDGSKDAISFEALNHPGQFLRHQKGNLKLSQPDGTPLFNADSSFFERRGLFSALKGVSYESVNYPRHYILVDTSSRRVGLWPYSGEAWIRRHATFQQVAPLAPAQ